MTSINGGNYWSCTFSFLIMCLFNLQNQGCKAESIVGFKMESHNMLKLTKFEVKFKFGSDNELKWKFETFLHKFCASDNGCFSRVFVPASTWVLSLQSFKCSANQTNTCVWKDLAAPLTQRRYQCFNFAFPGLFPFHSFQGSCDVHLSAGVKCEFQSLQSRDKTRTQKVRCDNVCAASTGQVSIHTLCWEFAFDCWYFCQKNCTPLTMHFPQVFYFVSGWDMSGKAAEFACHASHNNALLFQKMASGAFSAAA